MTTLAFHRWGEGSDAVLVHGSLVGGPEHWAAQRPLGEAGYGVLVVDRRGYGQSPAADGEDYLRDADDIVELLAEQAPGGAHLVGDSYGAIAALYVAARVPELVRSVTVMEPPAFGIVDDPACRSMIDRIRQVWEQQHPDDRAFLHALMRAIGDEPSQVPEPILEMLEGNVPLVRGHRPIWEADPPLEDLASHGLPVLVVSGGHHAAFEAVCDAITRELSARREVIPGAGHQIAVLGDRLNEVLLGFWQHVEELSADQDPSALA